MHKNILLKKLVKEGIDLEADRMNAVNNLSSLFNIYVMRDGKYAIIPNDETNKSNLAYLLNDLTQLQNIVHDYEHPVLKPKSIFFVRNELAILSINNYEPFTKFNDSMDVKDFDVYKLITKEILSLPQNDENLLEWMYYTGTHIIEKFTGSWALRKIMFDKITYFVPLIIGICEDVWFVGDFCDMNYYKRGKMGNIDFDSFYKTHVERNAWKPKISNLNIQKENLLFIDN